MASFFERDDWIPKGCHSRSNVESNVPPLLPLSSPFQRRLEKDTREKRRGETLSFSLYSFPFPVRHGEGRVYRRPTGGEVCFGIRKAKRKRGKEKAPEVTAKVGLPSSLVWAWSGLVYPLAAGREETE